jgi:hypothetical protein
LVTATYAMRTGEAKLKMAQPVGLSRFPNSFNIATKICWICGVNRSVGLRDEGTRSTMKEERGIARTAQINEDVASKFSARSAAELIHQRN